MKNNLILFLLSVLAMIVSINSTMFGQTVLENFWIPNNTVFATVRSGNTIYLGGAFTQIGPPTGCGAAINLTSGDPNLNYVRVNGPICVAVPDGTGGWYVGGHFSKVGGISRNNLAHINADGTLDEAWNPNVSGTDVTVRSLVVYGSYLYIGGDFTLIGGQTRNNLGSVNLTTGAVTNWNPGVTGPYPYVFSLAISNSVVYVGGLFTNVGGFQRNNIAAINASTGEVDPNWNPDADERVFTIAVSGSIIYAGGGFNIIGGSVREKIAALNITTGNATNWNPEATGPFVYTIALSSSTVYAGGYFSNIGGASRNNIAELDMITGNATDWNPNPDGLILALTKDGSILYVGGSFTSIGGEARYNIAAVDLIGIGHATNWDPNAGWDVLTIALSGSTIYAGGLFYSIGGERRNHLAAIDATTGQLTSWNPNAEGEVENTLGYTFGWMNKKEYQYGVGWDPINPDSRFCNAGESSDANIFTILALGSTIYIGGQFTSIGGVPRHNIAAINATTGEVIEDWDPNANGPINTLTIYDSIIYVGGDFSTIGNLSRNNIAALNMVSGDPTSWDPSADYQVQTILVYDTLVYVGGFFTNIGERDRNCIAAIDIESGVATDWDPNINAFSGIAPAVLKIAIAGTNVYTGGYFEYVGGQPRSSIAAIDVESGRPTNWAPEAVGGSPFPRVFQLNVSGSLVYVAGGFDIIGNRARHSIASIDAETAKATDWDPNPIYPGIPLPGEVYAMSVHNSLVYIGGFFVEVKDKVQANFAAITGDGVTVVTNSLIQGWQTLSVPVVVDDFTKTSVWPTANSVAYSFCGSGYQLQTILENGVGYWIGFPSAQDIFYAGEFLEQFETPVCTGWNIVGSVSEEAPISTNVCLYPEENGFDSQFFIYKNGYHIATSILPGMGYWIKVKTDGSLYVDVNPVYCGNNESISEEGLDHFTITDAEGKKQDLYVANLDLNPALQELDLSMPPPLPEVGFDARFSGDEYIKPVSPDSGEVDLEIDVEAQVYPISLSWELNPENGITYSFIGDSGVGKISDIKTTTGNISFNQRGKNKIRLLASAEKISNSSNLPTVYSLVQNYPNPFNPTTIIKYSLPKASEVKLTVYDILGREVITLVNVQQQQGSYEVKWDGSNVSSGIYFYQLNTKDYVDTKKMILLK